jgi:hypothetical protein
MCCRRHILLVTEGAEAAAAPSFSHGEIKVRDASGSCSGAASDEFFLLTKARRFDRRKWMERTCVVKGRCVFSIIVWILIIVIVLALLGFFARGRR